MERQGQGTGNQKKIMEEEEGDGPPGKEGEGKGGAPPESKIVIGQAK